MGWWREFLEIVSIGKGMGPEIEFDNRLDAATKHYKQAVTHQQMGNRKQALSELSQASAEISRIDDFLLSCYGSIKKVPHDMVRERNALFVKIQELQVDAARR